MSARILVLGRNSSFSPDAVQRLGSVYGYDDSADAEIIAACELLGLTCKRAETDPGVCHEDTILEGHKWDKPSERDVLQGARASATDAQFCEVA